MAEEIKTYAQDDFSDEAVACRAATALEAKRKYMRIKKRESRAKEKIEDAKQKAKDAEAERVRMLKRLEEERIADGTRAREQRVTLLTMEFTNPQPMPTELLSDGTNYALWVEDEIDNFVDDWCGLNADIMRLYHRLSVHPLGKLLLTKAGITPLPELQPPYSYIFTSSGVAVMHRPHGSINEVWEPYPTANKNGGVYTPPSNHVNSESVFSVSVHDAEIMATAKANKYERERVAAKEKYRNYLRTVEAKWKAWRTAARAAARATVSG